MFVKSVQSQLLSSKMCPENFHKIGHFLLIVFSNICPKNLWKFLAKSAVFFHRFVSEIHMKFDFFSTTYRKPCLSTVLIQNLLILQCKNHNNRPSIQTTRTWTKAHELEHIGDKVTASYKIKWKEKFNLLWNDVLFLSVKAT